MVIKNVDILNFKNIQEGRLEFSEGVNCLLGSNGMGKSNLLEAIHFVCMARPMTPMPESGLITHSESMMSVRASFRMDAGSDEQITAAIVKGKGKTLKRNGKEYDRISQHIGQFPVVSVTPGDVDIVTGAAQERRRMTDMVLSQASTSYISSLIRYNKGLENRNSLLRAGVRDPLLYESVEGGMADAAAVVHSLRAEWTAGIAPVVAANYSAIAGPGEALTMDYRSVLNEMPMSEVFERNRGRDAALGYTSAGIHRDDIPVTLDGYPLRTYGSQGQIKSFAIALRLAIFDYLRQAGRETPLLLLDDIFDKLDSSRVGKIMELVSSNTGFGQIFITDTNREHLDETLASLSGPKQLLMVENGRFETQL